jgi:hypothetical protein
MLVCLKHGVQFRSGCGRIGKSVCYNWPILEVFCYCSVILFQLTLTYVSQRNISENQIS